MLIHNVSTTNYSAVLSVRANEVKIDQSSNMRLSLDLVFEYRIYLNLLIENIFWLKNQLNNKTYPLWLNSKEELLNNIQNTFNDKVSIYGNVIILQDDGINIYQLLENENELIYSLRQAYTPNSNLKDVLSLYQLNMPH